jgi:adenylate cyclase
MTFLTTYFFRNDNEIRIIENNQSISAIIGQKVMTDFMAVIDKATLAAPAMINENIGTDGDAILSQRLFSSDGDILAIYLCTEKNGALAPERAVFNSALMNEQGISAGDLSEVIGAESKQFLKSFSLEEVAHNMSPSFKIPVIGVSVPFNRTSDSNASSVIIALIRTEKFNKTVSNQGITKSFIVNSTGDLLAHYNQALVSARANFQQFPIVKIMMTSPIDNGQTRYRDENGTWFLGSYKKIGFAGAGVISTVEEQKAFAAVYVIQRRNFLITVIVLSVAILIVYFFAKTLTGPVKRLVSATNEIEQGNFDVDIVRSTNDEIGLLTESFINMGHGLSEREKIKDAFGKFVNKDIAEKVLRDEIKLGGERKEVTIFFSDIRSFTAYRRSWSRKRWWISSTNT